MSHQVKTVMKNQFDIILNEMYGKSEFNELVKRLKVLKVMTDVYVPAESRISEKAHAMLFDMWAIESDPAASFGSVVNAPQR